MDSSTWIAVASIISAGLTISIGSIGPALGEGRALAQALSAIAQQPDEKSTITHTVRRDGDGRIDGHLLFCGVNDSDLRQSVLEPAADALVKGPFDAD